ncbi:ubiquinol cytochrome C oxidoreductase [Ruegeria arenilitoris]|uniref:ubiquinol cytochrome C oxidoreductase n=1 Tax=Ruegeria arenilitoris TaxID=1173585 RepID=UPI00147A5775|nr:ubiquinol cytochrome C oxidoreductase [Ruegeria arenilitoris]
MKTKSVTLYYVTAFWAVLTLAIGLYYLFSGTTTTADVKVRAANSATSVEIGSWEPGDAKILNLRGKPVVIWRRDQDEMARALEQFDPTIPLEDWAEAIHSGALERGIEPEVFANVEWFIASPISTAGFGCIVQTKAGDFDGFFDPCAGVHYDMWGRPQKGPTDTKLKTPARTIDPDRQRATVSLFGLPAAR